MLYYWRSRRRKITGTGDENTMAKILQCGSCRETMDITDLLAGDTVQCPECGQTARVPSGNTSIRTKTVSAPIPAVPAPSGGNRVGSSPRIQRARERSRSGTMPAPQQQKSHGGLFVGLGIGVLGIVIVVILFTMKGREEETVARAKTPPAPKGPTTVTFNPNLPQGDGKPIVLRDGSKGDAKPTTLSRPTESADNANWALLMNQLRPGGGFEQLDRPEGVAFQKVKSFGPPAYPKLIAFIEDEDPTIAIAAVAVLNALTGREEPLPKGVNKAKCKAEWEEWLKKAPAPKPDEPKK